MRPANPLIAGPPGCYGNRMTHLFDIGDHMRLLERFFARFARLHPLG